MLSRHLFLCQCLCLLASSFLPDVELEIGSELTSSCTTVSLSTWSGTSAILACFSCHIFCSVSYSRFLGLDMVFMCFTGCLYTLSYVIGCAALSFCSWASNGSESVLFRLELLASCTLRGLTQSSCPYGL